MLDSVVGCVQGSRVLFLCMSGISEHCMLDSVGSPVPGHV